MPYGKYMARVEYTNECQKENKTSTLIFFLFFFFFFFFYETIFTAEV